MKRALLRVVVTICLCTVAAMAQAETTLEKVSRTGTLTVGARTGSPPFAYVNKDNQWVGRKRGTAGVIEEGWQGR